MKPPVEFESGRRHLCRRIDRVHTALLGQSTE